MNKPYSLPPILYEDGSLIAFDKPSGLLVAPDRWDKTIIYLGKLIDQSLHMKVMNVHRLDRDTSGVMVYAKTALLVKQMTQLFESHEVTKTYAAITTHTPETERGVIIAPLKPDSRRKGKMCVGVDGKYAETLYEIKERFFDGKALLNLIPKTGRTHQLRVHLAHIGCPILNDPFYGEQQCSEPLKSKNRASAGSNGNQSVINRLALHASSVDFKHPLSGERIRIVSPLPIEFETALTELRRTEQK